MAARRLNQGFRRQRFTVDVGLTGQQIDTHRAGILAARRHHRGHDRRVVGRGHRDRDRVLRRRRAVENVIGEGQNLKLTIVQVLELIAIEDEGAILDPGADIAAAILHQRLCRQDIGKIDIEDFIAQQIDADSAAVFRGGADDTHYHRRVVAAFDGHGGRVCHDAAIAVDDIVGNRQDDMFPDGEIAELGRIDGQCTGFVDVVEKHRTPVA